MRHAYPVQEMPHSLPNRGFFAKKRENGEVQGDKPGELQPLCKIQGLLHRVHGMRKGVPPWSDYNRIPSMRKRFQKAVEVNGSRLLRIEEPGKVREYGIPEGRIKDVSSKYSLDVFLSDTNRDPESFGSKGMEALIAAIKGSGDRTWEMMEKVAEQTKVVFPSHVQYLMEAYIIALRPESARYSVSESTPATLHIQIEGCPCSTKEEIPCQSICKAAAARACVEWGLSPEISLTKSSICDLKINIGKIKGGVSHERG